MDYVSLMLNKGIKSAYNYCESRAFKGKKRHPSPLHRLMNEFQIDPSTIAVKSEAAQIEDALADEDLRAYCDGSMVDGGVGGAAGERP